MTDLVRFSNDDDEYDYLLKFILIGDFAVGKSSIIYRYLHGEFEHKQTPTIGIDFGADTVQVGDSRKYKVHIWDCGGQERYKIIIRSYFRNSHAICLAFDLTNLESWQHLKMWLDMAKQNIPFDAKYELMVIGNKSDNANKRAVSKEMAQEYANSIGAHYVEVSAKTGENIEKITEILVREIDQKIQNGSLSIQPRSKNLLADNRVNFFQDENDPSFGGQCGCCVL